MKFVPYLIFLFFSISCTSLHSLKQDTKVTAEHNSDKITELRFSVNRNLPKYIFKIHSDAIDIKSIEVATDADPTRIQQSLDHVDPYENIELRNAQRLLNTADYNFDGYQDLRLVSTKGVNNVTYTIWLFDPKTRLFKYTAKLSSLSSPVPLPTRKIIREMSSTCGGGDFTSREYSLQKGNLILVREVIQSTGTDTCAPPYKREVFDYRSGIKSLACAATVHTDGKVKIQTGDRSACLGSDFPLIR